MGLSCQQLRLHVVRPTLTALGLWSEAAENLVLGTAAHESGGFRWIDQVTGPNDEILGPAYGLYQIEPATHDDLWKNFLSFRGPLASRARKFLAEEPSDVRQLATNLAYATAICRLLYYRRPEPLPAADDLPALGAYYKAHYNTPLGKGTAAEWIENYRRYVA